MRPQSNFSQRLWNFDKKTIRANDGFTLVEVLLALVIFSIIAASIYSTLANGIRLKRRAQSIDDSYRQARWAVDAITLDLENMVSYHFPALTGTIFETRVKNWQPGEQITIENSESGTGDADAIAFKGSENQLILLLPTPDGLMEVSYYLEEPDYGKIEQTIISDRSESDTITVEETITEDQVYLLVREVQPFRGFRVDQEDSENRRGEREILSRHVLADSLKFSYADIQKDSISGQVGWQGQWTEPYHPDGVRIELTLVHPEDQSPLQIQKDILVPTGSLGKQEY